MPRTVRRRFVKLQLQQWWCAPFVPSTSREPGPPGALHGVTCRICVPPADTRTPRGGRALERPTGSRARSSCTRLRRNSFGFQVGRLSRVRVVRVRVASESSESPRAAAAAAAAREVAWSPRTTRTTRTRELRANLSFPPSRSCRPAALPSGHVPAQADRTSPSQNFVAGQRARREGRAGRERAAPSRAPGAT